MFVENWEFYMRIFLFYYTPFKKNESNVFKVWYDSISDVERADLSVLDDVISVRDGYKQCDLSNDEILLTIEIICTN